MKLAVAFCTELQAKKEKEEEAMTAWRNNFKKEVSQSEGTLSFACGAWVTGQKPYSYGNGVT